MKRLVMLALVLAFGISCDDSPTSPSANPNVARFTAILLPGNEVPPVTNADAAASGTMQMTMTLTRDGASNITGATYDFTFTVTGFPANTTLTGAHIHAAPAGTNAGVVVGVPLTATEAALATGQSTITKSGLSAQATANAATVAQNIFNNPAGNYFNVHTTLNGGGAVRGQLVKVE
ncbi:MAG TPA: CHRD domain-containing protein [Vicinamibacterales bacterium]|nr:CHRD domain-containing protein [Vicinamibacterales bacterium]